MAARMRVQTRYPDGLGHDEAATIFFFALQNGYSSFLHLLSHSGSRITGCVGRSVGPECIILPIKENGSKKLSIYDDARTIIVSSYVQVQREFPQKTHCPRAEERQFSWQNSTPKYKIIILVLIPLVPNILTPEATVHTFTPVRPEICSTFDCDAYCLRHCWNSNRMPWTNCLRGGINDVIRSDKYSRYIWFIFSSWK